MSGMSDHYHSAEYFEQEMQGAQCELSHYQDLVMQEIENNRKIKKELSFVNFKLENIKRIISNHPDSKIVELIKIWTEE